MTRIAVYPGSFDPPTRGHTDLVTRSLVLADRVIVAVATNSTKQPLFTLDELRSAGVAIALYPLSAFRAMNKAALAVYEAVRRKGTQKDVVATMQTRDDLYDFLDYHAYERKLDELFARK